MNGRAGTLLAVAILAGALVDLRAQQSTVAVALKTTADSPPAPDAQGIVTMTLTSGAWIKVRALDIDYEITSAYKKLVVVKALSAMPMSARDSGRRYMEMVFSNRFTATAWLDDVDAEETTNQFPRYWARLRQQGGITWQNFQQLQDGVSLMFANAILGRDGTLKSSSSIGGFTTELYQWSDDRKIVTAIFQNGKLVSKSQYGLQ